MIHCLVSSPNCVYMLWRVHAPVDCLWGSKLGCFLHIAVRQALCPCTQCSSHKLYSPSRNISLCVKVCAGWWSTWKHLAARERHLFHETAAAGSRHLYVIHLIRLCLYSRSLQALWREKGNSWVPDIDINPDVALVCHFVNCGHVWYSLWKTRLIITVDE